MEEGAPERQAIGSNPERPENRVWKVLAGVQTFVEQTFEGRFTSRYGFVNPNVKQLNEVDNIYVTGYASFFYHGVFSKSSIIGEFLVYACACEEMAGNIIHITHYYPVRTAIFFFNMDDESARAPNDRLTAVLLPNGYIVFEKKESVPEFMIEKVTEPQVTHRDYVVFKYVTDTPWVIDTNGHDESIVRSLQLWLLKYAKTSIVQIMFQDYSPATMEGAFWLDAKMYNVFGYEKKIGMQKISLLSRVRVPTGPNGNIFAFYKGKIESTEVQSLDVPRSDPNRFLDFQVGLQALGVQNLRQSGRFSYISSVEEHAREFMRKCRIYIRTEGEDAGARTFFIYGPTNDVRFWKGVADFIKTSPETFLDIASEKQYDCFATEIYSNDPNSFEEYILHGEYYPAIISILYNSIPSRGAGLDIGVYKKRIVFNLLVHLHFYLLEAPEPKLYANDARDLITDYSGLYQNELDISSIATRQGNPLCQVIERTRKRAEDVFVDLVCAMNVTDTHSLKTNILLKYVNARLGDVYVLYVEDMLRRLRFDIIPVPIHY